MNVISSSEKVLISFAGGNCVPHEDLFKLKLPSCFETEKLHRYLRILADLHLNNVNTAHDLAVALQKLNPVTSMLFSEAKKLCLVLSMPISVAESKRSFSCLRRLKT